MAQNYGLGRGLSSLIPQKKKQGSEKVSSPEDGFNYFGSSSAGAPRNSSDLSNISNKEKGIQEIDITRIVPNPDQPRIHFDEEKLKELTASIKNHGIIQPIVVSAKGSEYEIIAGERRFQAAKLAGLSKVPSIVRKVTDQEKLELAIVENIQRHDLNPIEEAKSYQRLSDEFDLTQEEAALKLGKSRSSVANKLRLLTLPIEIQKALMEGKITEGHAKAILAISNPEKQRALFELILKSGLTVRQTESKTREISVSSHKRTVNADPEIKALEDRISEKLSTKVKISRSGKGGKIVIDYYSEEELDNILGKIQA